MKKGLLGSTALIGATALMAGTAGAAEAPTWKLTGNVNFQVYFADRDNLTKVVTTTGILTSKGFGTVADVASTTDLYFGVDESELQLNVTGTADNGLNYGFKIEINANTDDDLVADEVRLQLSGGWGTVQMGDEDGAEDIMNYGGENLLGASGGWDGDGDDMTGFAGFIFPTITGDTSDATKISYFSPRFSGFQLGASYAPNATGGDPAPGDDTLYQNWISAGANYDNSFGNTRVQLSAVYASASYEGTVAVEDIGAWSVGGIVGFAGFSVGANYTDNAESATLTADNAEHSYWNASAAWESGPMYFSVGYIEHTYTAASVDWAPSAIAVTGDYTVAPGLGVYAEWTGYDSDSGSANNPYGAGVSADASIFILGANVSF